MQGKARFDGLVWKVFAAEHAPVSIQPAHQSGFFYGQKMIYYKRFSGDYIMDTVGLTFAEHGAFCVMLDWHYHTEKPLPVGRDLYQLLRCKGAPDRAAVEKILKQFWMLTPDGYINKRAQDEIQKSHESAHKNRLNGMRGGRPKKKEPETAEKPSGLFLGFKKITQT